MSLEGIGDEILHTDASEQGLAAALYQKQDDQLRLIAYGSHTLTPAERNCHLHSSKLEFLALTTIQRLSVLCTPF